MVHVTVYINLHNVCYVMITMDRGSPSMICKFVNSAGVFKDIATPPEENCDFSVSHHSRAVPSVWPL